VVHKKIGRCILHVNEAVAQNVTGKGPWDRSQAMFQDFFHFQLSSLSYKDQLCEEVTVSFQYNMPASSLVGLFNLHLCELQGMENSGGSW